MTASRLMSWLLLLLAIGLEVSGTTCLKLSAGFTRWGFSILVFVFYGMSFVALGLALKGIEMNIAYAVWAGLGTAFVALIGVVAFQESLSTLQFISLLLIILGVVGLNLAQPRHPLHPEAVRQPPL